MGIKTYKGTDKDMKCRGYQFEIGKTFEDDGAVRCGGKGFHSCEAPLDVFGYYPPATSRYFECEADGEIDRAKDGEDTKLASSKLTLKAEIGLPGIAKAHVEWVKSNIQRAVERGDKEAVAVGDKEGAAAGDSGSAAAGSRGSAAAGYRGSAAAGYRGSAAAGDSGSAAAGDSGSAAAGDSGSAAAGSYGSAAAGSRGSAAAGSYGSAAAGSYGSAVSRGAAGTGENGLSVVRGNGVKAKGGIGSVIVIVIENDDNYDIKEYKAGVVDGVTLKADTWYTLKNGEFVEVPDDAD